MKKVAMMIGAGAMALAASAAPTWIEFSSTGEEPDTYADGTPVLDGEVYALVWIADGKEFAGIDQQGKALDPANNVVLCRAGIAENGKCPKVTYVIDRKDGEELVGGTYAVYLFDTRSKTFDAEGAETGETVGIKNGGAPCKGWGLVKADITTSERATAAEGKAEITAAVGNDLAPGTDTEALKPVVTAFTVDPEQGLAYITVANTSPSLTYALVGRKTIDGENSEPRYNGIRGAGAGKELTLVFKDDPENQYRFYRVIRSK